jgi:hypothetical protein
MSDFTATLSLLVPVRRDEAISLPANKSQLWQQARKRESSLKSLDSGSRPE